MNTYNYLDLVPKGRDEDHLPFTMAWVGTTTVTPMGSWPMPTGLTGPK